MSVQDKQKIKDISVSLIESLKKNNFVIQYYSSYSTESAYIKLDFGLANSIRISNHEGKKHLRYRYNIILGCEDNIIENEYMQFFFNENHTESLIYQIILDRKLKLQKYGKQNYRNFMLKNANDKDGEKGFWKDSKIVHNVSRFDIHDTPLIFQRGADGHFESVLGNTTIPNTTDLLFAMFEKESRNPLRIPTKYHTGDIVSVADDIDTDILIGYFTSVGISIEQAKKRASLIAHVELRIEQSTYFSESDEAVYYIVSCGNYKEVIPEYFLTREEDEWDD